MNKKIFRTIWLVALSVFLASLAFIMTVSYSYLSSEQLKQLRIEARLAAQGVERLGKDYFTNLDTKDYRITWISQDGEVLFDDDANASKMQNHRERPEVQQAQTSGFGQATRHSFTLDDQQSYVALRLTDKSIIRMSATQLSFLTLLLHWIQPILIVVLIGVGVSFVLARQLSKKIMQPLNELDFSRPERYFGKADYQEIEPLLMHMAQQQRQLKANQEQIEKTALIRQEFTANASHELKTPLHVISGYAELLKNRMVPDENITEFADKICTEATRMSKLAEDIINLSKLDSGGAELSHERCDLYQICKNVRDSLEPTATKAQVSLYVHGDHAFVDGSPALLHSIVYNLCDNAIKYNHPGGSVHLYLEQDAQDAVGATASAQGTVNATKSGALTTLRVHDTGIGIPPQDIDRIFERFYRVDKSRSKQAGGTGLGLSIVKHAVQLHNGNIHVQSYNGVGAGSGQAEGTTFTVTFPAQ